jgi:hypothetical protein
MAKAKGTHCGGTEAVDRIPPRLGGQEILDVLHEKTLVGEVQESSDQLAGCVVVFPLF